MNSNPAFPCSVGTDGGIYQGGMTLYQWYAGMALQGLLSKHGNEGADSAAKYCFEFADAMIKAYEQREKSAE